ncbi:MAG TPA: PIG-L deacetylase family protein [Phototrophicaceae bacterium]|nr:PIG-L deacetylase family protein [Phototrophicaceae bacterium]
MTQEQTAPAKRVMGIFAHPDDPEFFCGATFARWAAEGAEIVFVLATSGDKGSADPEMTGERLAAIREEEERNAAHALGVKDVIFLHFTDGELEPSLTLRKAIVRQIRLFKPNIVVTGDPTVYWIGDRGMNHPDHRAIGEAVCAAVYPTARDRLNFPELERDEHLEPHKTKQLFISATQSPNIKVDVTAYVETKIKALREHKSQIADMEAMAERIRKNVDPESLEDYKHYSDSFRVITFDR